jgi:hypothetical protein
MVNEQTKIRKISRKIRENRLDITFYAEISAEIILLF